MDTKQGLIKELGKLTEIEVEVHEKLNRLVPPVANLSKDEKLIPWIPTLETLAEYDKFKSVIDTCLSKRRDIIEQLVHFKETAK